MSPAIDRDLALELISAGHAVALVARGNPVMLETVLWASASDLGMDSGAEPSAPSTPFFRQWCIFKVEPREPIGLVSLQSIPNDKVSMRLMPCKNGDPTRLKAFSCFCEHLLVGLAQSDFFASPDMYGIVEGNWCALRQ